MTKGTKYLAMLVVVLGIISVVVGATFIGLALQKNAVVTGMFQEQKITVGLTPAQIAAGEIVDNPAKVQVAADTIATHLKGIAPSYSALMATGKTGKFDPTNVQQLDYAQGMNIQNSLSLAILGYGVIQLTEGVGAALIIIGLGIALGGLVQLRIVNKASAA